MLKRCLAVQVSTDHASAYRHISQASLTRLVLPRTKRKNASLSACQRLQQDAREHTCCNMKHYLQHGSLYIVLVGWIALRGMQLNSVLANSVHVSLCEEHFECFDQAANRQCICNGQSSDQDDVRQTSQVWATWNTLCWCLTDILRVIGEDAPVYF